MKLYYSKGACSLTVRIIINELNMIVEYESVDLKTKKTETGKDFWEINSKGSVPTLELDNHEILTENAVILQYLADTSHNEQLLPAMGDFKRYRTLEWLNFVTTEMHKGVGILFNAELSKETKEKVVIPKIKSKLSYLDKHLQHHSHLLNDHFTLPDAYLFVILRWVVYFKFDLAEWPHIQRYYLALSQRPSILKSLKEEGLG